MQPTLYKSYDTSLIGEAEDILHDPNVKIYNVQPGDVFNPVRRAQNWAYPEGTKDVDALDFARNDDGTVKVFANGLPRLVDYYVSPTISTTTNFQTNPTLDGFVAKTQPIPKRQLAVDETLVYVRRVAGSLVVDNWWVRRGQPVPPPPPTGDIFTEQDRATLNLILEKVSK